jgi:hypothetical protein
LEPASRRGSTCEESYDGLLPSSCWWLLVYLYVMVGSA